MSAQKAEENGIIKSLKMAGTDESNEQWAMSNEQLAMDC